MSDTSLVRENSDIEPGTLDELVRAGVLYGRKKTKTHPKMKQYIFATRNGFEIIDVIQTLSLIDKAGEFLKTVIQRKGLILFVGTEPAARELVRSLAEQLGYPYVTERWLGGTLTNFKVIYKRVQYYLKLKSDRDLGRLEKYTKKERLKFDREIDRLTTLFDGLTKLDRLPESVVIIGVSSHDTAIREAKRLKIPIVGLLSSDADPEQVDYPIPANDRAKSSIKWVLEKLKSAIEEGRREPIAKANGEGVGEENSIKSKGRDL